MSPDFFNLSAHAHPLNLICRYLTLPETSTTDAAAFAEIFHPDVEQTEYPNALTQAVRLRGLADLLRDTQNGKALLARQQFAIQHAHETTAGSVVVEARWTGEIAADLGPFRRGQQLTAYFCMVFDFRDGRIFRQRNYDCFEPF